MGRSADDSIRRDAQSREITGTEVPSLKNKILMAIPETEYRVVQSHLEPFNRTFAVADVFWLFCSDFYC